MALAGSQQVHLAATVDGTKPYGGSPFPPCGAITPLDPFPQSPSPVYTLLTQNIIGGPYPYSSLNYPKANCAVDVQYFVGSTRQQSTILLIESYTTVSGGL
jgi:hypothetical protein